MTLRTQGHGGGGQPWRQHVQAAIGGMAFTGNREGVETVNLPPNVFVPVGSQAPNHPLFVLDPSANFQIALNPPGLGNETQYQVLEYTGRARGLCGLFTASVSFQDPAPLGGFGTGVKLTLNGVDIPGSEQEGQTGGLITSADSIAVQGIVELNPGDQIQVLVANTSDATNFIISSCHLTGIAF